LRQGVGVDASDTKLSSKNPNRQRCRRIDKKHPGAKTLRRRRWPAPLGHIVDDQKWSPAIFHRPELLKSPRIVTQDVFATAHAVILLPAAYTW
jgi:hypothetical protein